MDKPPHWIGIDVSKQTFDAAWCHPEYCDTRLPLSEYPCSSFPRSEVGAAQLLEWLQEICSTQDWLPAGIVMESTGRYSVELKDWLLELEPSLLVAIEDPTRTSYHAKSLGVRNKTDKMDAAALARYGCERKPSPFHELPSAYQVLRERVRYRAHVMKLRNAARQRLQELTGDPELFEADKALAEQLEAALKQADMLIQQCVNEHEELCNATGLMRTIPGVGPMVAAVVLGEVGPLERFARSRQLSAYSGLSPRQRQSGTSIKSGGHITRRGSALLRQMLFMASVTGQPKGSPLKAFSDGLIIRGKGKMQARCAVMRKLLVLMRAVVVTGKVYDPYHVPKPPAE